MRGQGIEGLRVDRDTAGLIRDFYHIGPGPFPDALAAAVKADPKLEDKGDKPTAEFDNDPRDTATPLAMARLFERIFSGKALSPASTRCSSGSWSATRPARRASAAAFRKAL